MKTVLRWVCLTVTILAQIIWSIPGVIYGIMTFAGNNPHWGIILAIPGLGFDIYALLNCWGNFEEPHDVWDVFKDEILIPINWYTKTFHGWVFP